MENKIAIIAAAKGYNTVQIAPWMESLKKTSFKGKICVLLYDKNEELAMYLSKNGAYVFTADLDGITNIATQRFKDYAQMIQTSIFDDIEWIIHTDIRDVIFQTNPTNFIKKQTKDIIATGEGVTYNNEDWNGEGMQYNYGENVFNRLKNEETMCSGIIAGKKDMLIHLFQSIYELAFYTPNPEGFADQHFYNLALREIYNEVTEFVPGVESWVANLGTLIAIPMQHPSWSTSDVTANLKFKRERNGSYIENMLIDLPILKNGMIYPPNSDEPYSIVHQYDRYKPWADALFETFLGINPPAVIDNPKDLGFYMWAYENVENVDYIFSTLRRVYPDSDIVISSDNGEDFSQVATKYNAVKYIHGTERHGYPSQPGRWGWTLEQAKLWLDRFYEACKSVSSKYIMMMDEDVLVKEHFKFSEYDMVMTPGIKNPISKAGLEWIKSRGGKGDCNFYAFGGGSVLRCDKFIQAYEKHKDSFFENYEEIFKKSISDNIWGWGWNDCMICSIMYADNATFSTSLPVIESGNEEDLAPIIHKFKKYYRNAK